jgi:preprotein translocase subunit Sec61beta
MVKRRRDKVKLPSSGAGLVRYMEEEGRGIKLKPEHVMIGALGVIVIKIALTSF